MSPEDVVVLLSKIGEMLSPTAKQAWDIVYAQVLLLSRVYVVIGIVMILSGIAGGIPLAIWLRRLIAFNEKVPSYEEELTVGQWFGVFGCGIVSIIGVGLFIEGLMRQYNPAWYTIKLLMQTLTGGEF